MSFLRKLISTPQGAKLLAEDTGISHMLLKCFAKARDMKKSSELFETVREALLTTVRMHTHLSPLSLSTAQQAGRCAGPRRVALVCGDSTPVRQT
jgi:hypothetical protein